LRVAFETGRAPAPIEIEFKHKDGRLIPVEAQATLILDTAGNPLEVLVVYRDIRDRTLATDVNARLLDESDRRRRVGAALVAIERRGPFATSDIAADPAVRLSSAIRPFVAAAPERAVLAVPFIVNDDVRGGITVIKPTGHVFTADEISLVEAFADQAMLAMER